MRVNPTEGACCCGSAGCWSSAAEGQAVGGGIYGGGGAGIYGGGGRAGAAGRGRVRGDHGEGGGAAGGAARRGAAGASKPTRGQPRPWAHRPGRMLLSPRANRRQAPLRARRHAHGCRVHGGWRLGAARRPPSVVNRGGRGGGGGGYCNAAAFAAAAAAAAAGGGLRLASFPRRPLEHEPPSYPSAQLIVLVLYKLVHPSAGCATTPWRSSRRWRHSI
jgi:hypothetical protein